MIALFYLFWDGEPSTLRFLTISNIQVIKGLGYLRRGFDLFLLVCNFRGQVVLFDDVDWHHLDTLPI